jgi:hypothetical protein
VVGPYKQNGRPRAFSVSDAALARRLIPLTRLWLGRVQKQAGRTVVQRSRRPPAWSPGSLLLRKGPAGEALAGSTLAHVAAPEFPSSFM